MLGKISILTSLLLMSCAPVTSSDTQVTAAVTIGPITTQSSPEVSNDYCYFLHAYSRIDKRLQQLPVTENTVQTQSCRRVAPTVGILSAVVGASSGSINIELPVTNDLQLDLIAVRKSNGTNYGPVNCQDYRAVAVPDAGSMRLRLENVAQPALTMTEDSGARHGSGNHFQLGVFASKDKLQVAPGPNNIVLDRVDAPVGSQILEYGAAECEWGIGTPGSGTIPGNGQVQLSQATFQGYDTANITGTCGAPTVAGNVYKVILPGSAGGVMQLPQQLNCQNGVLSGTINLPGPADTDTDGTYVIGEFNGNTLVTNNLATFVGQRRYCAQAITTATGAANGSGQWFQNAVVAFGNLQIGAGLPGESVSNPIKICTAAQFQNLRYLNWAIASNRFKHWAIRADLNFLDQDFYSIGDNGTTGDDVNKRFYGYVHGNGHTLSNMVINAASTANARGIFGSIGSNSSSLEFSSIDHLNVKHVRFGPSGVYFSRDTGFLVGAAYDGLSLDHIVIDDVQMNNSKILQSAGGVVGLLRQENGYPDFTLTNVLVRNLVIQPFTDTSNNGVAIGGLIAKVESFSTSASVLELIVQKSGVRGTLIGQTSNCIATNSCPVGGFIAQITTSGTLNASSIIEDSYANTTMSVSTGYSGGFIGRDDKVIAIKRSYAAGAMTYLGASATYLGRFFGSLLEGGPSGATNTLQEILVFTLVINGPGPATASHVGQFAGSTNNAITGYASGVMILSSDCAGCASLNSSVANSVGVASNVLGNSLATAINSSSAFANWHVDGTGSDWRSEPSSYPRLMWEPAQ